MNSSWFSTFSIGRFDDETPANFEMKNIVPINVQFNFVSLNFLQGGRLTNIDESDVKMLVDAADWMHIEAVSNQMHTENVSKKAVRGTKRKQAAIACDNCRESHLSCTGHPSSSHEDQQDCSGCIRRGFGCHFSPKKIGRRAKKQKVTDFFG